VRRLRGDGGKGAATQEWEVLSARLRGVPIVKFFLGGAFVIGKESVVAELGVQVIAGRV